MAIDLDEAFKRAVKKFYDGAAFENYEKATGEKVKYNKDVFDEYEKGLRPKTKKKTEKEVEVKEVE
ncbi:hypothetical protein SmphiM6_26 [Sinorhizobium phage phiM6]|nr:hypothetical protein SmphiM6_26 [Sinorhizobium phage phiM6]